MYNGLKYLSSIIGLLVLAYCFYVDMPWHKILAAGCVLWAMDYLFKFLSGQPHPGYEYQDEQDENT